MQVRNNNTVHSYFWTLNQQKKQKLLVRTVSRSSRPLKNDLVARCSEAYVMKDAKIKPPTTIKPNLWKEETCVYILFLTKLYNYSDYQNDTERPCLLIRYNSFNKRPTEVQKLSKSPHKKCCDTEKTWQRRSSNSQECHP